MWDRRDKNGRMGALTTVVVPWLVDRMAEGVTWQAMAWWIHDNLPYSELQFFPKLLAYELKEDAAPGVDRLTWTDYEADLECKLVDLHDRVHRGAYRALPSRRVYIPKPDGRQRPLAVTALEDKIFQRAVVALLNVIYEEDFLGFSYGFRRGRGTHDALDALCVGIHSRRVSWILDADIRSFFDTALVAALHMSLPGTTRQFYALRKLSCYWRAAISRPTFWVAGWLKTGRVFRELGATGRIPGTIRGRKMATTRRELLGASASAAFGLIPLGGLSAAVAQITSGGASPTQQPWDAGELAHVLPTSSHDRILLNTSFKRPLEAPPILQIGDQRVLGQRTDTGGSFWQFHAAELKGGTTHTLSLASSDGRSLCQPWTLSTMPALDELPSRLRLLVYSMTFFARLTPA
jgi:hypothetical protein